VIAVIIHLEFVLFGIVLIKLP